MKMIVVGAYNLAGTSKTTKRDYSLHRVYILEQIDEGGNMVAAFGYKPVEYEITPEAMRGLIGKTFPVDLELDIALKNGKPLIIGVINQPSVTKAA